METRRVLTVDAFTADPLTGNPAGVVPVADGLSDRQMQAIARELALSETAFVLESEVADRRLRYFTPTTEVDLCGHATVGTLVHLRESGAVDVGTTTIETAVGVLEVEVRSDGTAWMSQDRPTVRSVDLEPPDVADALGIEPVALEEIVTDLPMAVASTGVAFLIVPVTYLEHLGDAAPDEESLLDLCESVDAAGVYAFTFDALDPTSTAHGRCFAPPLGIDEDPVTGTASGAVAAYLEHFDAFGGQRVGTPANEVDNPPSDVDVPEEIRLEQGHFVDRPGIVHVEPGVPVRIGGRGVVTLDGSLVVPDDEEDRIIEA